MTENELYHHGIKGQRWGKRNGPPYPLSEDDHSLSEKKAGWKKSLDSNSEHEKNGFRLTDKQKKIFKDWCSYSWNSNSCLWSVQN